jgi:hypothetical protein
MISISDAVGSRERKDDVKAALSDFELWDTPVELVHLDYGDFAFVGNGPGGRDVLCGIELKRTHDLLACIKSKRFAGHQLLGLSTGEAPMYDRAWLLTEGIWRENAQTGAFESLEGAWRNFGFGNRHIQMRDVEAWLYTQVIAGGLGYWHAPTKRDTARFIVGLYHWWTGKAFEDHRAHEAIYLRPPDRAMMSEPSDFLKQVSVIRGVGWEKGMRIEAFLREKHALSDKQELGIATLCDMSARDLQDVDGIGPKLADNIRKTLFGVF